MDFQTLLQRGCEQERQPHLPRRRKYIICMMRPELEVGQQKGRQAGLQQKKVLPDGISSHQYSARPQTRRAAWLAVAPEAPAAAADDEGRIGTGTEGRRGREERGTGRKEGRERGRKRLFCSSLWLSSPVAVFQGDLMAAFFGLGRL